jgi:hypothetical protein
VCGRRENGVSDPVARCSLKTFICLLHETDKGAVAVVLEPFSYSSKSTGAHVIPLQSFASIPLFQTVSENIIFPVLLVHFSYGLEEA